VSAGRIDGRDAVSFVLRRGRGARSGCRWKTLRIGNAHAFHEAPAEPVLAAFEPPRELPKKQPTLTSSEEATGASEANGSRHTRRKKTPPRELLVRSPKWEARREARFSPVSSASGGPEPPGACLARLRTGEAVREEDVRVDGHGAARFRDESETRAGAERPRTSKQLAALGSDESTSARVETVSECRSRSDASPVATPAERYQAHHGHARPSSKESPQGA